MHKYDTSNRSRQFCLGGMRMISVLPIYIVLALGFWAQKRCRFDIRSLSDTAIYLLYPFLAFRTFNDTSLTREHGYIALFLILLNIGIISLVYIISRVLKYPASMRSALVLAGVFMNAGNYGAPLILFALGEEAFSYAVVIMVIQSLLMSTVGLYFAASGSQERGDAKNTLKKVFAMPVLYATFFGWSLKEVGWEFSELFHSFISFMADAAIPLILLALGMQLSSLTLNSIRKKELWLAIAIKMFASPTLGVIIALLLPVDPLIRTVLMVISFMPTAANTTLFAVRFNVEPELVASSAFVSTLLSTVTLPIVLLVLK